MDGERKSGMFSVVGDGKQEDCIDYEVAVKSH